jgi:hypothetical protein
MRPIIYGNFRLCANLKELYPTNTRGYAGEVEHLVMSIIRALPAFALYLLAASFRRAALPAIVVGNSKKSSVTYAVSVCMTVARLHKTHFPRS